ncbi:glycosyltransferase [Plantactinospora siamensis]|uniref:Glycosyltransferase n=1 Tax=Plantactinospora siamensis TaxID=555372 RepID=A0ABV6P691_9ACTN
MTTLLVASTGGHLAELHDLAPRLGVADDCVWVTFDSPQSRSLLDGREVIHVPSASTRDAVGTLRDFLAARRVLRSRRVRRVISTGASVAMSFFVPASRAGLSCAYIESATRTSGPSLTGRLAARLPRAELYTQYASWAGGRWRYGGSIFDPYLASPVPRPATLSRIVVALGTHDRFGFPRLLSRLVTIMPTNAEVLWQVGSTRIPRMPRDARRQVPFDELEQAMREADVVITHAGVGSALTAMRAGRRAIQVPRRQRYGEHIDDHQVELARELDRRGLVLAREADAVTIDDLWSTAGWAIRTGEEVTPFRWTEAT